MWVLGYHGPPIGWHDGAICLVDGDGHIWAYAEQERFSRTKHALNEPPVAAVDHCLAVAGITRDDVDVVAVGWDLPAFQAQMKLGWPFDRPAIFLAKQLGWGPKDRTPDVVFTSHHRAHAASAFYASGFSEASILVVDGQGEKEGTSVFTARYGEPVVWRDRWPTSASLGFLYDAACRAIGLDFLEAGKTMGLASYGKGRFDAEVLFEWDGGSYRPPFTASDDASYVEMIDLWMAELATRFPGLPRSTPRDLLHEDEVSVRIAHTAQATIEDIILRLADHARGSTGIGNLCIAGGVGLNCSANGMIGPPVYVPPVSYDAGVAVGAAWLVAPPKAPGPPLDPFLGHAIGSSDAADEARAAGLTVRDLDAEDVIARLLTGQVGALAWGRAEIGARALGHRSIIALPDDAGVADHVNTIKSRELWRPLAPVGLAHAEGDLWAEHPLLHKYMLGAVEVTPRGEELIPATVHVDGTARAQIVDESDPGPLADILRGIEAAGHPPVLMNTSFNGRSEPIVNTATDALKTFRDVGLDFLVVGDLLVTGPSDPGEQ